MNDNRISGYLTCLNGSSSGQPFEAAIRSMLGFCFEVVVADGGSTDDTWERLVRLAGEDRRIRPLRYPIDASSPSWALDVGLWLRAKARRACKGDYCWEGEPDEIVTQDDWRKVGYCLDYVTEEHPLVAVPILEYSGGTHAVRRDVYPAAPKLSRNLPSITHGLPCGFRAHDDHGLLYALPYASLASTYIDTDTLQLVPCWSLLPHEVEQLREMPNRSERYEAEFYDWLDDLPVVHQFGWISIEQKLQALRDFWSRFEASFYRIEGPISAWPLFDRPWNLVTDQDIARRADDLAQDGPGKLSGETRFPALMAAKKELPADIRKWLGVRRQAVCATC